MTSVDEPRRPWYPLHPEPCAVGACASDALVVCTSCQVALCADHRHPEHGETEL